MSETELVLAILGGRKTLGSLLQSERDFTEVARRGIPFPAFEKVTASLHLSLGQIEAALGLSKRTLQRRRAGRLTATESERVLRLARTAARAEKVLGEREAALDWLNTPNRALGGERPLELLDTEFGAKRVHDTLGRIEYGVYT